MQVNVPNVGLVNFPDSMSQDEVASTIKTKLLPQSGLKSNQDLIRNQINGFGQSNGFQYSKESPASYTDNQIPPHVGVGTKDIVESLSKGFGSRFIAGQMQPSVGKAITEQATPTALMTLPMLPELLGAKLVGYPLRALFGVTGAQQVGQGLGQTLGNPNLSSGEKQYLDTQIGLGGLQSLGTPKLPETILAGLKTPEQLGPLPLSDAQRLQFLDKKGKSIWEAANRPQQNLSSAAIPPQDVQQTATVPATKTTSPVSSLQGATPVSGTASLSSNLGMLDRDFRHKVANVNGTISVGEQAGLLQPQEASALRGQLKLLGMKANTGGDVVAKVDALSKQAKDISQYRLYSQRMGRATDPIAQQDLFQKLETIKNQYGGMPPKIGEQVNEIQPSGNGTALKQEIQVGETKGLPQEGEVQSAPQKQVSRNVERPTGGNVIGDGKGDGGLTKAERDVEQQRLKNLGEGGFVIAPKEIWDKVWSNKTTKIDSQQMFNRLKNVLGETSALFQHLQGAGLGQFLQGGKKSTEDVEKWAEGVAPKVEVRKFGRSIQTPEQKEMRDLEHNTLDYLGVIYNKEKGFLHNNEPINMAVQSKSDVKNLVRYKELADNPKNIRSQSESHWQSIAPKSEQDMPEYVEIAVVKPQRTREQYFKDNPNAKEVAMDSLPEGARVKEDVQFPSSHNFPPNTLGFVRGYMENVGGKKVFHVIEVQSDWAQKMRDDMEKINKPETPRDYIKQYNKKHSDPLLPHYERLALKAAIEHARSEGADAIAISDAETAMMSERHDQQGNQKTEADIPQAGGMRLHYDDKFLLVGKDGDVIERFPTEEDAKSYAKFNRIKLGEDEATITKGTLQNIAEELTGQKGEKVGFGEHKMAFDVPKEEGSPYSLRKDLIFRNEKGEPKTDVSARMYDISKAKKEFSLYGRTGAIFPESPVVKALKEVGAKEEQNAVVSEALKKLDSLKSVGSDIYDAATSTHAWKSWWLKRQGYDLPKIEAISPTFANSVSSYANSQVASVLRANANISKVLGDKADNIQFRKQLGGIIYEDMRRAEGGIGNSVLELKNSPFASEEQYQNALKNPEMQQALARWKELVQKPATETHEKLGGQLAESGQKTGAFGNLIAVMQDERKKENIPNSPSTVGPLSTMKKGSAFSKERKFSGQEYNLDAKDMAFRMMTKNAQQATLRDMYAVGEKEGLLKLLKQGEETPPNMIRQKNPVTLRTVVKDGETFHTSAYPAFDSRVASTLSQALQLDRPLSHLLDTPAIHAASQIVIKTQVAMGIDLGFHTFNDVVAVANSPKGLLALPQKAIAVAKANQDLVANNPTVQEELARMAESGITFRGDSLGGWSSKALKVADTVTRVVLNREYEQLVAEKKVIDSPAERRRYINGRAGQYNKRFMTWFQQGMQESGLGAFNVAGRNFNRLAVGNLIFSPGVKATSKIEALRLRATIAAGIATAALIVPSAVNIATTGSAKPEGTELGDIVVGKKKDGTYEVLNMRKWTMLARGGRASGLGAVMNEQVLPRIKGEQPAGWKQTLKDSATDIGRTALAPFSGPPVNLASTLLTGKTELGFGYDQRTAGEKAPYVKAAIGTLNPLVGPVVTQKQQGGSIGEGIAQRLGSVIGLQSSQSPFSIIRNRAVQYKLKNKIGSDDGQSYGPSEYLPLKNALLQGNVERAKQEYQQLLHDKSQNESISDDEAKKQAMMAIQKEFTRLENFRFVNKESEEQFKGQLSPEQRDLYQKAVDQQKKIADTFFQQIQGKISNEKKKGGFQPPTLRGFKKLTMLDESNLEHRAIAYALLNKANGNVELAKQLAEQQGYQA